jgi:hypothetical protein
VVHVAALFERLCRRRSLCARQCRHGVRQLTDGTAPPCHRNGATMIAPPLAAPLPTAIRGPRHSMPRDVEILLPSYEAPAHPPATVGGDGDTGILALLGMFTVIDAVLVVLWGLM